MCILAINAHMCYAFSLLCTVVKATKQDFPIHCMGLEITHCGCCLGASAFQAGEGESRFVKKITFKGKALKSVQNG